MAIERGFRAKLRYRVDEFIGGGAGKQLLFLALLTVGLVLFFTLLGVALGLGAGAHGLDLLKKWRVKSKAMKPMPPVEVADGPVLQNRISGDKLDILSFPAPKWHEKDGGRYLGTGCSVITVDPETYTVTADGRELRCEPLSVLPMAQRYFLL